MQETKNAVDNPAALSHAENCEERDPASVPVSVSSAEDRDLAALSRADARDPAPTPLWYWAQDGDLPALS
jgi:hypothetical protein